MYFHVYLMLMCRSLLGQIGRQACVFTFGFGAEHDADLLHAVADAGNGLFYYIDNSDSIPESFCDCLGGLLSVAAQVSRLNSASKTTPCDGGSTAFAPFFTVSSPGPIISISMLQLYSDRLWGVRKS